MRLCIYIQKRNNEGCDLKATAKKRLKKRDLRRSL